MVENPQMGKPQAVNPWSAHSRPLPENVVAFPAAESIGKQYARILGGIRRALFRGIRQRCPACGQGKLFRTFLDMHEGCASCGVRYSRESGQWIGSLYINTTVTALVLAVAMALVPWRALSFTGHLILWESLAVLFPLGFFRVSRGIWMGLVYLSGGLY
jgi:uncharacterized protein (DUF983 family)